MQFVETYASIEQSRKINARNFVRNVALDTLSILSHLRSDDIMKRNRIQFLYVHHIFKDEEKNFIELIRFLQRDHTFISYSDALAKLLHNNIDKPYVCLSFDDGFKNNVRAAEILNQFNVKACFFVCPDMVEEKDYGKIKQFCAERLHLPPVEFMNWDDIQDLLKHDHEIGSHTMNHINVAALPCTQISDNLHQSLEILTKHCGNIRHFAYPYGRYFHFNECGRKLVFNMGFQSCSSAERGCHIPQEVAPAQDELLIRRDHMILKWDIKHIKYFIKRNAGNAAYHSNEFKYSI